MKLNKRKIYQVFRDTQVEDDCQRKFNLDSGIIYFSSRGYDREEKSIYVGFYLKQYKDSFDNEHFIELLEDELFADSREELVLKARQWYKNNFAKALKILLDGIEHGIEIKGE